ncbi:hypothetical protein, partial [Nitrosomonas sp. ANs5]|uniref:hypothetical protein n=1 Tax=Nitrosomonas sp. ANs5 TaxID=3423941 RepID=UPI003D33F4EC
MQSLFFFNGRSYDGQWLSFLAGKTKNMSSKNDELLILQTLSSNVEEFESEIRNATVYILTGKLNNALKGICKKRGKL